VSRKAIQCRLQFKMKHYTTPHSEACVCAKINVTSSYNRSVREGDSNPGSEACSPSPPPPPAIPPIPSLQGCTMHDYLTKHHASRRALKCLVTLLGVQSASERTLDMDVQPPRNKEKKDSSKQPRTPKHPFPREKMSPIGPGCPTQQPIKLFFTDGQAMFTHF